eukprot:2212709-Karenia_brevis.AAC.1
METEGIWAHLPSLVDDLMLITEPRHVDRCLEILVDDLAKAGMKLNLEKSAAFVPRSDRAGEKDASIMNVPQVHGGLPALGCAYGGDYESILGPYS